MKKISLYLLLQAATVLNFCGFAFPGTVIDQTNRKVIVRDNPVRVVSLAPNVTEIVCALGQRHRLAGVTMFSNYPEPVDKLPKVGSYIHPDIERIVALRPDLCIGIKDGNPKQTVLRLTGLNVPVYMVDPRNCESVMNTITEIGRLLNADNRAKKIVQDMRTRIQKVKSLVAKTDKRPKVFFQIGADSLISVGTNTFIHELILTAGGRNLGQGAVPYPVFSREQALAMGPDLIIITCMQKSGPIFEKAKAEWSKLKSINAVKNNRIFSADPDILNRPGPRLVDGLEILLGLIHPGLL